jgi:hypothetical protein
VAGLQNQEYYDKRNSLTLLKGGEMKSNCGIVDKNDRTERIHFVFA